jgi:hypothetical protein
MSPEIQPHDDTTLISRSRQHIESMLDKLPESLKDAGRETVVQVVCDELRKIPVPLLGSILAKAVEKQFGGEKATDDSVYELGEMLQSMQESDDAFQRQLESINIFLPEVMESINKQEQRMLERDTPDLQVLSAKLDLKYPVNDNELRIILSNTGGSSVMVDEILLEVRDWEPYTSIDFSMPAAPMQILFLKAELSVEKSEYPLFSLNDTQPRIFGERGDGAELIVIQLSSISNAKYSLQLKIPYQDLSTGNKGIIYYPDTGENLIELPFPYSPGWNQDITPESILERTKIFSQMELKFRKIYSILKDVYRSDENNIETANEKLFAAGLTTGIGTFPDIGSMLSVFGPVFLELASSDRSLEAEKLIQDIRSMLPGKTQRF